MGLCSMKGVVSNTPLSRQCLITFLMVVWGRLLGSTPSGSNTGACYLCVAVASIVTKMGLWSETWSTGLATTAFTMAMFLVQS